MLLLLVIDDVTLILCVIYEGELQLIHEQRFI